MSLTITTIASSPNLNGSSSTLLEHFIKGMKLEAKKQKIRLTVQAFHLEELTLPYLSKSNSKPNPKLKSEQDIIAIAEAIERSTGLVISTPVWNFTYPARLKNVIDRLGFIGLDYSNRRTRPKLQYISPYLLFSCGAKTHAWLGLLRWTSAFTLQCALAYYGAKFSGVSVATQCTSRNPVSERTRFLRRIEKKGSRYLRKLMKKQKRKA